MVIAFAVAIVAVGVPYWMIPYRQLSLPDALPAPGLLIGSVSALLLCLYRVAPFRRVAGVMAATVPLVVMARVLVGGVRDPTSHNLWPFEVAIAMLVGLVSVLPAVVAGHVLQRVLKRRDREAS